MNNIIRVISKHQKTTPVNVSFIGVFKRLLLKVTLKNNSRGQWSYNQTSYLFTLTFDREDTMSDFVRSMLDIDSFEC